MTLVAAVHCGHLHKKAISFPPFRELESPPGSAFESAAAAEMPRPSNCSASPTTASETEPEPPICVPPGPASAATAPKTRFPDPSDPSDERPLSTADDPPESVEPPYVPPGTAPPVPGSASTLPAADSETETEPPPYVPPGMDALPDALLLVLLSLIEAPDRACLLATCHRLRALRREAWTSFVWRRRPTPGTFCVVASRAPFSLLLKAPPPPGAAAGGVDVLRLAPPPHARYEILRMCSALWVCWPLFPCGGRHPKASTADGAGDVVDGSRGLFDGPTPLHIACAHSIPPVPTHTPSYGAGLDFMGLRTVLAMSSVRAASAAPGAAAPRYVSRLRSLTLRGYDRPPLTGAGGVAAAASAAGEGPASSSSSDGPEGGSAADEGPHPVGVFSPSGPTEGPTPFRVLLAALRGFRLPCLRTLELDAPLDDPGALHGFLVGCGARPGLRVAFSAAIVGNGTPRIYLFIYLFILPRIIYSY